MTQITRLIMERLRLRRFTEVSTRSLYVCRHLVNTKDFLSWAGDQGFPKTMDPKDLHVTVLYSVKPVDWNQFERQKGRLELTGGPRTVMALGDEGAVVLKFSSPELAARHKEFMAGGAHHGYSSYKPHVTITYEGAGVDLKTVEPFEGTLVFGPEQFASIDKEWKPDES